MPHIELVANRSDLFDLSQIHSESVSSQMSARIFGTCILTRKPYIPHVPLSHMQQGCLQQDSYSGRVLTFR